LIDVSKARADAGAASPGSVPVLQGSRHGLPELQAGVASVRAHLWRAFGFGLCASVLGLAPSWYMLEVYDRVLNSRSSFTLLMLSVAVLLAYALIQAQEWARTALMRTAGEAFDRALRPRIFHAALAASRSRGVGGGAQALADLRSVREFFDSPVLVAVFESPTVLVFLVLLLVISPWLALVAVTAALLQCLIGWLNERATGETLRQANRRSVGAQLYAEQLLHNAQVVQAMGMVGAVHRRWLDGQREALALQQAASQAAGNWQAGGRLLQNIVSSGLLGLSCWLLLNGHLNGGAGMLVVAGILGGRALAPFIQVVTRWQAVIHALEAWSRLAQLLKAHPAATPGMPLPAPAGAVAVEHVSVNAPGSGLPLLRDLHFMLQPGDALAVVGPSSAGKTTLARVLLGLWPAHSGKVRLAGADVSTWDKSELGPHLGYLPQGVELLDGSLAANICRFGAIDPQRLQAVIEETGLGPFVQELPQGLDTPVGPAGAVLSGGQRQRVGLARALYGEPALVVLDEPNAHLDEAGDTALVRAIESRKRQGTTFVVITHRSSVLAACDKLLLLQEGRQQAFGPRDEVLAAISQASARATTAPAQALPVPKPPSAVPAPAR